jgi:hypothetical protein
MYVYELNDFDMELMNFERIEPENQPIYSGEWFVQMIEAYNELCKAFPNWDEQNKRFMLWGRRTMTKKFKYAFVFKMHNPYSGGYLVTPENLNNLYDLEKKCFKDN